MEDETKELPLEMRLDFKQDYDPADCRKKKASRDYYLCKESEKAPLCRRAFQVPNGNYYCPRELKE